MLVSSHIGSSIQQGERRVTTVGTVSFVADRYLFNVQETGIVIKGAIPYADSRESKSLDEVVEVFTFTMKWRMKWDTTMPVVPFVFGLGSFARDTMQSVVILDRDEMDEGQETTS